MGGICDDDTCPTHDPNFHEEPCRNQTCPTHGPMLPYIDSLPQKSQDPQEARAQDRKDEEEGRPPAWMVRDGLLLPDGTPTPVGRDNLEWIAERYPQATPA